MADEPLRFTMTEAALDAFRRRDRRGVLLGATLVFYVAVLLLVGVYIALLWPVMRDFFVWMTSVSKGGPNVIPPPQLPLLIAAILACQFVYSLLLAIYEAACLRWLVRGETGGLFGLAIDVDTVRVWLTYWVWLLLTLAMFAIPWSLIAMSVIAAHLGTNIGGIVLLAVVSVIAVFVTSIWLAVRLAPAAAVSVAEKRFAFFDAWKVTRGRFWSVLGAFFLTIVAYYIAGTLVQALYAPVVYGSLFEFVAKTQAGAAPSLEMLFASLLQPWSIALLSLAVLLSIAIAAVLRLAWFGINARAVRVAQAEGTIPTT